MSTPPASPAQPQGNPNWIVDEPPISADNNPPNDPYSNAYIQDDPAAGESAANPYIRRDSAQSGPVQSDYIQDDTWTGPAVAPRSAGYSHAPPLRSTPMLAPRGLSRRAPSKLVQTLLVLLAVLVVVALAATLVVYQPGSLATVLPGASQEAAPATAAAGELASEAAAQTGVNSDVFVVPEGREEAQNAANDTANDVLTESAAQSPSSAAPADTVSRPAKRCEQRRRGRPCDSTRGAARGPGVNRSAALCTGRRRI